MSPNTTAAPASALAARLLTFSPDSAVTDALLPLAEIADSDVPVAAAPSLSVGSTHAKRGVRYAASLARATTANPDLLERLGRMSQKTVRRLVAAQLATPPATLEKLAAWALETDDTDTLYALFGTMPPPAWIPRVAHRYDCGDHSALTGRPHRHNTLPIASIVDQLSVRGDDALVWDTVALGITALNREIAKAALNGNLPVDVVDVVEAVEPAARASVLAAVLTSQAQLPDRVVDHVVAWVTTAGELPEAYVRWFTWARPLSPYAVTAYLASGHPLLARAVATSTASNKADVDDDQLDQLTRHTTEGVCDTLLADAGLRERLSIDQLSRVAIAATPNVTTVRQVLVDFGTRLSSPVRVALLRHAEALVTADWICGQLPVAPTVGEVEQLAADPGRSLHRPRGPASKATSWTVGGYVAEFAAAITIDTVANPGVGDLLNAAGPVTLQLAAQPSPATGDNVERLNGFAAYLAGRLTGRFGPHPGAWATAARIADRIEVGTVDDFLTVIEGLLLADPLSA